MDSTIMNNKEWQETVTSEKRLQLVDNLIQGMTTLQKTSTEAEQYFFDKANFLEKHIFEEAVSRADYYNCIAQQVYKLRENSNEQGQPNSSTGIEDLFANLQLSDLTFEDENNDLHLANGDESIQDTEQQNKVTYYHVKFWYMLLHAFECIMTNTEKIQCTISYCSIFRNLLIHLRTCHKDANCNKYQCNSLLVLHNHWTTCTQENCLFCKKLSELKKPAIPSVDKDWYKSCTFELREHLIIKLINTVPFLPSTITASYMQKMEKESYEMANCRSEYYHLLAEKIYKIQTQAMLLLVAR